jgi:hypothetical protein
MLRCGDHGFLTKAGKPCGYKISDQETCCPHHDEDKSRAKRFQTKGWAQAQENRLPRSVMIPGSVTSVEDLQATYTAVIEEVCTVKKADLKRMDVILRALSGANAVLQTKAVSDLNDTVMRAEGHGPALVILEGLKKGRTRRLPGIAERKAKVEDAETA